MISTMKNTNITLIVPVAILLLMTTACRSSKQMGSIQSTTSTITTQSMDSLAKSILSTRKTTTTITFLPMQTPAFTTPAAPDIAPGPMPTPSGTPAAPADLLDLLLQQGGGTIIITKEESTQNDTTTTKHHIDDEQTQNESENHETQSTSQLPRASPWIDRIFYTFLAAAFLVLLLQARPRQ